MQKAFKIMSISLQNELEYRFNYITNFVGACIPFIVNLLIWYAVERVCNANIGYTFKEMVSYYFYILLIGSLLHSYNNAAEDIRTGTLNSYLIKPYNYILYSLFVDLPKRVYFIVCSILPIAIATIFFRSYIGIQVSAIRMVAFIIALCIGYIINFLLCFILNEYAFYFTQIAIFNGVYNVLLNMASGKLIPLDMLSGFWLKFFQYAPFQFCGYYQTVLIMGRNTEKQIAQTTLLGCVWIIILFLICTRIWKSGLKKYSAYGG